MTATKAIVPVDAKKELVKAKSKKPSKKQAVLAGLLRYKEMANKKIDAVKKKNEGKIVKLIEKFADIEKQVVMAVQNEFFKMFGKKGTLESDSINVHMDRWNKYASIGYITVGNFQVTEDDNCWSDSKKIQSLLKTGSAIEANISELQKEIANEQQMMSEAKIKFITAQLRESMSVGSHLSDMEVAIAIVADKENADNIDNVLTNIMSKS